LLTCVGFPILRSIPEYIQKSQSSLVSISFYYHTSTHRCTYARFPAYCGMGASDNDVSNSYSPKGPNYTITTAKKDPNVQLQKHDILLCGCGWSPRYLGLRVVAWGLRVFEQRLRVKITSL
jgi:hypothetical protein